MSVHVIGANFRLAWIFLIVFLTASQIEAKILQDCEGVKELQKANVPRSFISNWICLMKSESGMDTRLVTGPKTAASYSFGIFQINSLKWCVRGRPGGYCNKRCEDFANDDIQDDIVCALKIQEKNGFKEWSGWMKKCKGQPDKLPDIGKCKGRSLVELLMT